MGKTYEVAVGVAEWRDDGRHCFLAKLQSRCGGATCHARLPCRVRARPGPFTGYYPQQTDRPMMTESESAIASPSSPINAKTKKSQRQHKGKAKLVSPNSATVNPTPPAHTATSSSQPERNDSDILAAAAAAAASSDHDYDNIVVESGGDYGDFDYDAVKADDGVELWLVRAPSTVRMRSLSLSFPPSLSLSLSLFHFSP